VFEFIEEGSGDGTDESCDCWFVGLKEGFEYITILRISERFVTTWAWEKKNILEPGRRGYADKQRNEEQSLAHFQMAEELYCKQ